MAWSAPQNFVLYWLPMPPLPDRRNAPGAMPFTGVLSVRPSGDRNPLQVNGRNIGRLKLEAVQVILKDAYKEAKATVSA